MGIRSFNDSFVAIKIAVMGPLDIYVTGKLLNKALTPSNFITSLIIDIVDLPHIYLLYFITK